MLKFISKLRKLHVNFWYLIVAISVVFRMLYQLKVSLTTLPQMLALFAPGMEQALPSNGTFIAVTGITMALFYTVFFELIAYFVYTICLRNKFVECSREDFIFPLRLSYIIANIVIGLISLIYFLAPGISFISALFLDFSIFTAGYLSCYWLFCRYIIRPNKVATAFAFIFRFYFIFYVIFAIFNIFSAFSAELVMKQKLLYIIELVPIAIGAVASYFIYLSLKKRQDRFTPPPVIDDTTPPPAEIFKGFGF